ncbi:MAG: DNA repair protein RecO [Pseudomonadota bacterium]|nr:DNA repair protein RecO [Pseudomonadota bacterium]
MNWSDTAYIIGVRKHGENGAIVHLFTKTHGAAAGFVHGASSKRLRGVLQPGVPVTATWRARTHDQLGTLSLEPLGTIPPALMASPLGLMSLQAIAALLFRVLPEGHPYQVLYDALDVLIEALAGPDPVAAYIRFELLLLAQLGFGLRLDSCALTGTTDDLAYVSPKTGRAANKAAGMPWHDRLLPLPAFLLTGKTGDVREWLDGMRLTGYFLTEHLLADTSRRLPDARGRLVARLEGMI